MEVKSGPERASDVGGEGGPSGSPGPATGGGSRAPQVRPAAGVPPPPPKRADPSQLGSNAALGSGKSGVPARPGRASAPAVKASAAPQPAIVDVRPISISENPAGGSFAPHPGSDRPSDAKRASLVPPGAEQRVRKRRLGEVLVDAGVVTDADVARALEVQKMGGGRLGGILVKLKLVTDDQIRKALAEQLGMEVIDFDGVELDETVLKVLPRELIKKYEAIPVRIEQKTLYVAMKDPYNFIAVDDIGFYTGLRVVVLACTEAAYAKFVAEQLETQSLIEEILEGGDFYHRAVSSIDTFKEDLNVELVKDEEDEIVHDLRLAGEHPPIITLCNFLLVESIQRRASDIHIEPYETFLRVRLRVDGKLQTLLTPPQRLHEAMITRLKIIANMDIAVRRAPQDGHIAIVYRGETCHYRVSTLPTVYGEKCVIRLLKKDEKLQGIDTLGFPPAMLKGFKRAMKTSQGIVLVTGPTGSGKTTTLHAGLSFINDPETNIVTLEDPVEASLPGVNHVQINVKAGVTFASGLRSILRQDPDVVFVGEMRDPEVSQIAVKAALTGHLVLSTLHTNSAAESLMRLEDMGIPTYLMANALLMIVAQRLVRKVCRMCVQPYVPDQDDMDDFRLTAERLVGARLVKGAGCDACFQTGYHGRQAVYEAMFVNNAIRSLIRTKAPVEEVIQCAEENGMQLLFDAGIEQALRGETTLAEVRRVLSDAR